MLRNINNKIPTTTTASATSPTRTTLTTQQHTPSSSQPSSTYQVLPPLAGGGHVHLGLVGLGAVHGRLVVCGRWRGRHLSLLSGRCNVVLCRNYNILVLVILDFFSLAGYTSAIGNTNQVFSMLMNSSKKMKWSFAGTSCDLTDDRKYTPKNARTRAKLYLVFVWHERNC